jgi:hypothetical protein
VKGGNLGENGVGGVACEATGTAAGEMEGIEKVLLADDKGDRGRRVYLRSDKGGDRESEHTGNCDFLVLRDRACRMHVMGQERRLEIVL